MALSWEVCRTRESSAGISRADNDIDTKEERSWSTNYIAIASGITDPFEVSELSAMRAPGVPRLRHNVYVDPDGTVFPYFSCKDKSCTRNPSNPYVFDISCDYTDASGNEGEDVQADPEDYAPSIKFSVKSRQRSAWTDVDGQPYMLPTGSKYKQALSLDYACLVATVVQLENTFGTTDLKNRMLKVNTSTWNVMTAETALITQIKYETVEVPVGVAGIITGYQSTVKVTYTIEQNDLEVKAGLGTAATVNGAAPAAVGIEDINWLQFRPRIDSLVRFGNKVVAASGINQLLSSVYLQPDGKYWHGPHRAEFASVPPPVDTYRIYENASFNFLRI